MSTSPIVSREAAQRSARRRVRHARHLAPAAPRSAAPAAAPPRSACARPTPAARGAPSDRARLSSDFCAEALEVAQLVLGEHAPQIVDRLRRPARRAAASAPWVPAPGCAAARPPRADASARSASSLATLPVSISSRIFSAVLLPIPSIFCSSCDGQLAQIGRLRRDRLRGALVGAHAERVRIALLEDRQLGELVEHVQHVLFACPPRRCFTSLCRSRTTRASPALGHNSADGESQIAGSSCCPRVGRARLRPAPSAGAPDPAGVDVADDRRDPERRGGPHLRDGRHPHQRHGRRQRPRRRARHHQRRPRALQPERGIDLLLDGAVAGRARRDAVADARGRRRRATSPEDSPLDD